MSKRSFKTCNTEQQKIRWRIKIRLKKCFRSWCEFRNEGGKEKDHTYHWARMLRSIDIIEEQLRMLDDPKRKLVVEKRLERLKRKMEKYQAQYTDVTKEYGDTTKWLKSKEFVRTVKRHVQSL